MSPRRSGRSRQIDRTAARVSTHHCQCDVHLSIATTHLPGGRTTGQLGPPLGWRRERRSLFPVRYPRTTGKSGPANVAANRAQSRPPPRGSLRVWPATTIARHPGPTRSHMTPTRSPGRGPRADRRRCPDRDQRVHVDRAAAFSAGVGGTAVTSRRRRRLWCGRTGFVGGTR